MAALLCALLALGPLRARAQPPGEFVPVQLSPELPAPEALARRIAGAVRTLTGDGSLSLRLRTPTPLPAGSQADAPLLDELRPALARALDADEGGDPVLVTLAHRRGELLVQIVAFARPLGLPFPRAATRLRVPLDASLRRHVAAEPRLDDEAIRVRSASLAIGRPLALAAHDLDGDGVQELVLVDVVSAGTRVIVGRLEERGRRRLRFRAIARELLPNLSGASVSPRRPLVTLAAQPDGSLVLHMRRFAESVRIQLAGEALTLSPFASPCDEETHPVADGCATPYRARDYFVPRVVPRRGSDAVEHRAPASYYHRERRSHRLESGHVADVEVVATPRGRLVLRVDEAGRSLAGYGSALALGDVDGDEDLELLASSAVSPATTRSDESHEELRLLRVQPDGALRAVWTSEALTGSVLLATPLDQDGDGLDALVALEAERGEERPLLWLLDREPSP